MKEYIYVLLALFILLLLIYFSRFKEGFIIPSFIPIGWTSYPNTNFPQNDIRPSVTGKTPTECMQLCYTDTICKGVVYNVSNGQCWKKNSLPSSAKTTLDGHYTFQKNTGAADPVAFQSVITAAMYNASTNQKYLDDIAKTTAVSAAATAATNAHQAADNLALPGIKAAERAAQKAADDAEDALALPGIKKAERAAQKAADDAEYALALPGIKAAARSAQKIEDNVAETKAFSDAISALTKETQSGTVADELAPKIVAKTDTLPYLTSSFSNNNTLAKSLNNISTIITSDFNTLNTNFNDLDSSFNKFNTNYNQQYNGFDSNNTLYSSINNLSSQMKMSIDKMGNFINIEDNLYNSLIDLSDNIITQTNNNTTILNSIVQQLAKMQKNIFNLGFTSNIDSSYSTYTSNPSLPVNSIGCIADYGTKIGQKLNPYTDTLLTEGGLNYVCNYDTPICNGFELNGGFGSCMKTEI
jgi:hypothetical protein